MKTAASPSRKTCVATLNDDREMKEHYKIIILTIFVGLTIFGCNQTSDKHTQDKFDSLTVVTPQDTSITKMTEVSRKPDFDVAKFVTLTDSLLTKIQGRPISLTFKIDTIIADKIDKRSFYSSLLAPPNTLVKRFSFDPGKGSRELRIWFVEATYEDKVFARNAFEALKKDAYDMNDSVNWSPGLTYTNDYVIISDRKIYWLNSGCPYSFFNHQKIKQYMLQSLQIETIQDSIWCKCGQPKCSL